MLYYQTVSPDLIGVLKKLIQLEELKSFRLVSGTSLALQTEYRQSIDIDLFTSGNKRKTNNACKKNYTLPRY
jgi:hypothetical protein